MKKSDLRFLRFERRAGVLLAALMLAGCAALTPATPEQAVQKRAIEYWQARIAGDQARVYALSAPSYRKANTQEQFVRKYGGNVGTRSAEVSKVECEPKKCTVTLKLEIKPPIPGINIGIVPLYMDEVWLLEDGQWWHYQDV